jgi:MFS family permease
VAQYLRPPVWRPHPAERRALAVSEENRVYRDPNLRIIFSITLISVMGVATIAPVFPMIARELGIPTESVGLLITVFTLPGIVLTPIMGILADRYGRKKVLVPSLLLYALAGGSCALARDFNLLLLLRFLQGVGGASIGSVNVTLIGDLFQGRRRTAAMGYNASVLSIGTASYPSIGGALALFGWFVPFLMPLAAIPVAIGVFILLDPVKLEAPGKLSVYLGGVWKEMMRAEVLALFLIGLVTFILIFGPYLVFLPVILGTRFQATPLIIGIIMSCGSLSTAVTSARLEPLSRRFSQKGLIRAAFFIYAVAFLAIPFLPTIWLFPLPVMLFGFAQGINYPAVLTLLAGLAPTKNRAAFMSTNGMVLRTGQTLGPVVTAGAFLWGGIEAVFHLSAALSLALFLVIPLFLRIRE